MSREGDGRCGAIDPQPARARHGHVRNSGIASAAGGGWTSHNPSPGGAMEEGRPRGMSRRSAGGR